MSNIYIQEPPTLGKVLLVTTVGDIDVELWSKEAPKACRNFVQLCMEGYYNNTIFHRVVKDFIVQGGDPTGSGQGGDSIYGEPFKDEIHSRLRFNRRGLLGMANAGKDDNGSQFFFTLGATPELQGKHTIFGKVVGDTIYNMIKLDADTDGDERPLHCHKIIQTEILNNPFSDIIPRVTERKDKREKRKSKEKGVKNFKLLSFGEEAEEDEEETTVISKSSKIKSSHDILDDPKLSKAAVEIEKKMHSGSEEEKSDEEKQVSAEELEESDEGFSFEKSRQEDLLKRKEEIQKQIVQLKDDYRNRNNSKAEPEEKDVTKESTDKDNKLVEEYRHNLVKYSQMKTQVPLKGSDRESFTMKMLAKFKNKLKEVKDTVSGELEEEQKKPKSVDDMPDDVPDDYDGNDGSWMAHTLKFENNPVVAKDANTKGDDWYEITDPRSAAAKRRRAESAKQMNKHSKKYKK